MPLKTLHFRTIVIVRAKITSHKKFEILEFEQGEKLDHHYKVTGKISQQIEW